MPVTLNQDTLLTVKEVAEILRVPVSWVYEHTRRPGLDRLPHLKIGKYLRFRCRDIEHFINRCRGDQVAYGAVRQ